MRQSFGTIVGLACAAVFAGSVHAQKTLNMQAMWPSSLTLYDNFTFFAERVSKLTGGELKINTMPSGQVVPAFEVLDATHKKVIDGAHGWAGYWIGKDMTSILFTGGPGGTFGMDFIDAFGWLHHGGGLELYREFYSDVLNLNVYPIPILPAGPQAFGWFKKPINSLADLKGLKCRQTGISAQLWERLGMQTVNMPGGEIMPAAQRGVIDCAEWVGGVEDLRFGFHNIWKYHYTPGMHEPVTIGELIVNGDVWRSLTQQQREVMQSAATETFFVWWSKWQKQNADAIKTLREKGAQLLRTPPDILIAYLQEWDKMAAQEAKKNPFFKKVFESQRSYASRVVPAKRFMFPPYSFAANYYWPVKK